MDMLSLMLAWTKSDFHGIISGNGWNSNTSGHYSVWYLASIQGLKFTMLTLQLKRLPLILPPCTGWI